MLQYIKFLKNLIKFYVFHGCKHDGVPNCALKFMIQMKNLPEDD